MCFEPTPRRNPVGLSKRRRAFSLIEVMVVVAIIGMLAGAVVIGATQMMDDAKHNRIRSDLATISSAVEAYYLSKGRYPTNDEGLENLSVENVSDPWGRPYEYNSPGNHDEPYEIICFGADGREGGEGADADIYSWDLDDQESAP